MSINRFEQRQVNFEISLVEYFWLVMFCTKFLIILAYVQIVVNL